MNSYDTDPALPYHYSTSNPAYYHHMAKRIVQSESYKFFYLFVSLLSIFCLLFAFVDMCPNVLFIMFETVVNVLMIAEVSLRCLAAKHIFFRSFWNWVDVMMVMVCVTTLIQTFKQSCDRHSQQTAMFDGLFIFLRNVAQVIRLIAFTRRNVENLKRKPMESFFELLDGLDELNQKTSSYDLPELDDEEMHECDRTDRV